MSGKSRVVLAKDKLDQLARALHANVNFTQLPADDVKASRDFVKVVDGGDFVAILPYAVPATSGRMREPHVYAHGCID